jgi:predicted ferric reductase
VRTGVIGEFLHLNATELTIALATVATAFLGVVAVSSIRFARRRVAYESWFYVHLLSYAMVALSFPHIVSLGTDFDHHKWNTRYWGLLYGLTIAAMLVYRVGNPLRNERRHRFRLAAVTPEAPGVVSLRLAGRHVDDFAVRPGQFVIVRFRTKGWRHKAHPFSVSGFDGDSIRITVKGLGNDSGRVSRVPLGTRAIVEGPYGAFTEAKRTRRKVLLVAGGIGITPLRTLFEHARGEPGDVTLLYRARNEHDIVFRNELDAIAAQRGFHVHYATGPRAAHAGSFDAADLTRWLPDIAERDVFLCGPADLVASAKRGLRAAGVPRRHIHHENFAF